MMPSGRVFMCVLDVQSCGGDYSCMNEHGIKKDLNMTPNHAHAL